MYYQTPFFAPNNFFRAAQMDKSYKTLNEALSLVKEAIQDKREDELLYDYLISVAPTEEEKDIIASIRDDERKHIKYFREIYAFYTGESVPSPSDGTFEKPQSYIAGIRKAKLGELGAVERYRDIRAGIPDSYYRDMVFEILTDELKHAHKYDYILYLSLSNMTLNNNANWRGPEEVKAYWPAQQNFFRQTREFTLTELAQYDGAMGRPAYVAVNGIVYDISNEATWGGASHFGLMAGNDLSAQFQGCHGSESILAKLPKVGILKV
jgi:predicted heme/steroid binding protein/rubrerythrin